MIKPFLQRWLPACIIFISLFSIAGNSIGGVDTPHQYFEILSTDGNGIIIKLHAQDIVLDDEIIAGHTYTRVRFPEMDQTQEPGKYQLPVISKLVGIPGDIDFRIEILSETKHELPGVYQVVPAAIPVAGEDLSPGQMVVPINPGDIQSSTLSIDEFRDNPQMIGQPTSNNELYPQTAVQLSEDAWLRDQRFVRVSYFPVQYQAETDRLIWNEEILFRLVFDGPALSVQSSNQTISDNPFEEVLKSELLNYQEARNWRGLPTSHSGVSAEDATRFEQTNSLLSRYKINISQDGIYRLTYENLLAAGAPVALVNPATFRMSSQGREVGYIIDDVNQNQIFEAGEAVIFYGQKFNGDWMATRYTAENKYWLNYSIQLPDGTNTSWKPSLNAEMLEKYTDVNVYWLEFSATSFQNLPNKSNSEKLTSAIESIMSKDDQTSSNTLQYSPNLPDIFQSNSDITSVFLPLIANNSTISISSYKSNIHYEQDNIWKTTLFNGEDTWYWEEVKISTSTPVTRTYQIPISVPASGNFEAKLRGEIIAAAYNDASSPDHHIKVYINDTLYSQPIYERTWDGKSRLVYETTFDQSKLVDGVNQLDVVFYKVPTISVDDLFVNWFEIEFNRQFVADSNRVNFTTDQNGVNAYKIGGFTSDRVWLLRVTNPLQPEKITNYTYSLGQVEFQIDYPAGEVIEVAVPIDISAPEIQNTPVVNFDQPADYLIITDPTFSSAAQSLANYRSSPTLQPLVININDLYNEFNDGIYHPIAIKNFLTYTFTNWDKPPVYVLLVGDGHWNFKGSNYYDSPPIYMPPYLAWVDPWQGEVDSANLLATVVGDDPLPDVYISRLPVNSNQQLLDMLSKIQLYEQSEQQEWQNHFLFIADNTPDSAGDFVQYSEGIINDYIPASSVADRIYLDNFTDSFTCGTPNGSRSCPAATQAILNDLNNIGAVLVNYIGHASLNYWTSEQIFHNDDISMLQNSGRNPIFLSMTCLDGYWIHPNTGIATKSGPGLAEELLRKAQHGAVGTFSPTGLGVATGHDALQRGFYDSIFISNNREFGQAALSAKLRLYALGYSLDLLHTFTVFGDPAMKMQIANDMASPVMER